MVFYTYIICRAICLCCIWVPKIDKDGVPFLTPTQIHTDVLIKDRDFLEVFAGRGAVTAALREVAWCQKMFVIALSFWFWRGFLLCGAF